MRDRKNRFAKKKFKIRNALCIIFSVLFLFSIYKISKWFIDNNKTNKQMEIIHSAISVIKTDDENNSFELEIDFTKLKELNNDTVGYLIIKNTNIDYPVVKTSDNDYYLHHGFDKRLNGAGWIFSDFRNRFDGSDKNIIIYGHNRKDGIMFGTLDNVFSSSWNSEEANLSIDLYRMGLKESYRIFSCYETDNTDDYLKTNFDGNEFLDYINTVKKKSIKDYKIEVNNDDNILTLSTCGKTSKTRIVVHAVKVNNN